MIRHWVGVQGYSWGWRGLQSGLAGGDGCMFDGMVSRMHLVFVKLLMMVFPSCCAGLPSYLFVFRVFFDV